MVGSACPFFTSDGQVSATKLVSDYISHFVQATDESWKISCTDYLECIRLIDEATPLLKYLEHTKDKRELTFEEAEMVDDCLMSTLTIKKAVGDKLKERLMPAGHYGLLRVNIIFGKWPEMRNPFNVLKRNLQSQGKIISLCVKVVLQAKPKTDADLHATLFKQFLLSEIEAQAQLRHSGAQVALLSSHTRHSRGRTGTKPSPAKGKKVQAVVEKLQRIESAAVGAASPTLPAPRATTPTRHIPFSDAIAAGTAALSPSPLPLTQPPALRAHLSSSAITPRAKSAKQGSNKLGLLRPLLPFFPSKESTQGAARKEGTHAGAARALQSAVSPARSPEAQGQENVPLASNAQRAGGAAGKPLARSLAGSPLASSVDSDEASRRAASVSPRQRGAGGKGKAPRIIASREAFDRQKKYDRFLGSVIRPVLTSRA